MSIAKGFSALRVFYKDLSCGNSLYDAIASMRQAIRDANKADVPLLAFPALYSCTDQSMTFDPKQRSILPGRLLVRQMPLKGTTEGYSEDFVGRKRDLQRLVPALSEGIVRTLVLTGPASCGKSALVARLANKLESAGFFVIAISSLGRTL